MDKKKLFNNKWLQLAVILLMIFAVSRYAWNKSLADAEQLSNAIGVDTDDATEISALLKDTFGPSKLKDVIVEESDTGLLVNVFYNPGRSWNEKSLLKESTKAAYAAFLLCFENSDVETVFFRSEPKNEHFISIQLDRMQADSLDWDTIEKDVDDNYALAFKNASSYEVHDELKDFIP